MITGAVFDVDGTLLDSMPVWDRAGADYLRQSGIMPRESLGREMMAMSMEEGASYLREQYGLTESAEMIREGVAGIIGRFYREEAPLKEGAQEFLQGLKDRGVRMTAATSSDRSLIEAAFERLGIHTYFERIYTCTEIGAGKSDPAIFLAARDHMGTRTASTWVFEDALYAILTAGRAGFRTAGVYDDASRSDQERIRAAADIYLPGFGAFDRFIQAAALWDQGRD